MQTSRFKSDGLREIGGTNYHNQTTKLSSLSTPAVGERVDVLLARTQEVKKVHAHILAGLTKAQKNQVVAEAAVENRNHCSPSPHLLRILPFRITLANPVVSIRGL